jgi:uncharacterized membrane protein YfcA
MTQDPLVGFVAGLVIAAITSPVGISGAVFLLPVQLSVLGVASPAVTPTNLLFNVVAVPGALVRYGRKLSAGAGLTRRLALGTIPGVVLGAVLRVYFLPGGTIFRLLVAVFLLPLGLWLITKSPPTETATPRLTAGALWVIAAVTGVVGGIYGIGGGSLLAPVLVGSGFVVAEVAPAALACTFITSCVGAVTYLVLDATGRASAGPHWAVGLACGFGGLVGGYLGAALQPHLPQRALRRLLGLLAAALAIAYLATVIGP